MPRRAALFGMGMLAASSVGLGAAGVWEHEGDGDYVVVVHGMGRTRLAMLPLCRELKKRGFHVINVGYPSLVEAVETLEEEYLRPAVERYCTDEGKRIHFVGHSLGNILVRRLLAGAGRPERLGKVVMLAPPNGGSDIIDKVGGWRISRIVLGPVTEELGTGKKSTPNALGAVDYPVAVIMGNKEAIPFFRKVLRGESDGIVTVERGRVEGMAEFHVCDVSHTFIMNHRDVREKMVIFLGRK